MQEYYKAQFSNAAENSNSAFCAMPADCVYFRKILTAIISMMAVVLYLSVFGHLALAVIISIIFGVIILIVRGSNQPVSRTR